MNIYNDSHCADLTAAEAIKEIEKNQREEHIDKRARRLFSALVQMIDIAGFELNNRIEITHRRTGRKYK